MTHQEFQERCSVRRLNIGDVITSFDCNDEDLNDFILNEANLYRETLLSVTYVVEDKKTKEVLAYFSLSNDKISIVSESKNLSIRNGYAAILQLRLDALP